MPSLDDLSDDQIMQYLKDRKGKKRYRVREYEIDGEDFARLFGLGEPSPTKADSGNDDDAGNDDGDGSKRPTRLRAADKFFGTGS